MGGLTKMQSLKFLNTKEAKEILELIKSQWDADVFFLLDDYLFLYSTKDKIYIISRDVSQINLENLKLNSVGLYFGELKKGQLRLSIEGSQLIGQFAKKNVVEMFEDELQQWIRGKDLFFEGDWQGYVLIKHKNDFLGTGRYTNGMIMNFVPKARRLIVDS